MLFRFLLTFIFTGAAIFDHPQLFDLPEFRKRPTEIFFPQALATDYEQPAVWGLLLVSRPGIAVRMSPITHACRFASYSPETCKCTAMPLDFQKTTHNIRCQNHSEKPE